MTNGKFTAQSTWMTDLVFIIIMEAIKRAKELGCKVGVYGASTTGEETTKTGAFWTSSRIKPTTGDCGGCNLHKRLQWNESGGDQEPFF